MNTLFFEWEIVDEDQLYWFTSCGVGASLINHVPDDAEHNVARAAFKLQERLADSKSQDPRWYTS